MYSTGSEQTALIIPLMPCWRVYTWKLDNKIEKWAASWQNQQNYCVPSEDSDQPWHPPSLIRVFAVRMKKAWVLSYPLSAQRRLWLWKRCPGWSESLLGAPSFCWFCHKTAQIRNLRETTYTQYNLMVWLHRYLMNLLSHVIRKPVYAIC